MMWHYQQDLELPPVIKRFDISIVKNINIHTK